MAENQETRRVLAMLGYEPNKHIVIQELEKHAGILDYTDLVLVITSKEAGQNSRK